MSEQSFVTLPVLPLRDVVVFPHMIVPLFVGRDKSVRALEAVMAEDKQILLSSQIDTSEDEPTVDTIFDIGVIANVLQLLKLPDGTVKVLVEGKQRVRIGEYLDNDEYFEATAELIDVTNSESDEIEALTRTVSAEFERYAKLNKNVPDEALSIVAETKGSAKLADTVAGHLALILMKNKHCWKWMIWRNGLKKSMR